MHKLARASTQQRQCFHSPCDCSCGKPGHINRQQRVAVTCNCMTAIPNSGLWGSLHTALPVNILGEIWRAITNLIHFPSPWHFLPKKGWDECGMLSVGLLQRLGDTYDVLVSGFVANSKYKIQALFKDPNCIFQAPKLSTKAIS